MQEKRSERRLLCADLVQIRLPGAPEGASQETIANLEDISPSGACLHLEGAIREGTDVEIICSECRFAGKVRYCRFVQIGYDVGVEFDRAGEWDRARFEPQHLLDIPGMDER